MFPEIFHVGPFALYTYGFMLMLAFALGIWITIGRAKKVGIESGVIWDLSLWILFSSLTGSRLLYVLTHLDEFSGNWFAVVNPVQADGRIGIAGMALLGGVATALLVAIIFMRRRRLRYWQIADLIAPAAALGIALGRIGCFANGCCYGQRTSSFLGVIFPLGSPAGETNPGVPVLPTQLFEAGWGVILLGVLLYAERWKRFEGFTFGLFLIGYGLFRFLVDFVRVYDPGEILFQAGALTFTYTQALAILMIVFGVGLQVRKKNEPQMNSDKGR